MSDAPFQGFIQEMINEAIQKAIDKGLDRLAGIQLDRERYLTIPDVAKLSAVSKPTVRSWIEREYFPLPAYKVGRDFKIKYREFEEWFAQYRYEKQKVREAVR
jgi:excisionase family DNA binding protein